MFELVQNIWDGLSTMQQIEFALYNLLGHLQTAAMTAAIIMLLVGMGKIKGVTYTPNYNKQSTTTK